MSAASGTRGLSHGCVHSMYVLYCTALYCTCTKARDAMMTHCERVLVFVVVAVVVADAVVVVAVVVAVVDVVVELRLVRT